jgi:5-methylcytosine-specific restriction endonuclease McrA
VECDQGGFLFRIRGHAAEEILRLLRRDQNRVASREQAAARKVLLANAPGEYTAEDILRLDVLQDSRCYFCGSEFVSLNGKKTFEIDHLRALTSGGSNWPNNLALVCKPCNTAKYKLSERRFWARLAIRIGIEVVAAQKARVAASMAEKRAIGNARKLAHRRADSKLEDG